MKISSRKKLLEDADIELKKIRDNIKVNLMSEGLWDILKSLKGKSFFPIITDDDIEKKEIDRINNSPYNKPPYANRWGEKVLDPDISYFDYDEMRRKDPTLPKLDPRLRGRFLGEFDMSPARKWLYFSQDFGSYANRLEKMVDPDALKKKYPGYWPDLMNKMPDDIMTVLNNKGKYRGIIEDIIYLLTSVLP